jgi:hypothetical protein
MKGLIAEYLATNRDALVLLHQGATIRHARYAIDFARGYVLVSAPHLNKVRAGERLLCLEAVLRAEQTNSPEAVASIESGFGLANSLSTEPYLISQLVRGACDNIGVRALERVLNRVEIADTNLTELISALSRAENPQAMKLSFLAERCLGIDAFEKITGWGFKDILNAVSGKSMEINPDYRVSGSFVLFWNATGFKERSRHNTLPRPDGCGHPCRRQTGVRTFSRH